MQGKVAIVTGAGSSGGIGRAIALAMALAGAEIVVADINAEGATAVAGEVRALGRRALAVCTDVSREDQVNAMVEAALAEFGRIDVLVNDAGITRRNPILETSSEEWDLVLSVNLKGTFLCTRAVLPAMIRQRYGRIVSIASVTGERGGGPRSSPAYAASKGGIIALTKTVARQVAEHGITCNAVAPGYIDTELSLGMETPEQRATSWRARAADSPLGKIGMPEDVAAAVLFLASDQASFITGEVLDVNGGAMLSKI